MARLVGAAGIMCVQSLMAAHHSVLQTPRYRHLLPPYGTMHSARGNVTPAHSIITTIIIQAEVMSDGMC